MGLFGYIRTVDRCPPIRPNLSLMSLSKIRFRQRFLFFLERYFIKGAHFQLLLVAALIGLISIIAGILVWPVGEGTLPESIWWAFLRLSDPGYLGDDEGLWRRFISTIVTVLGYVVFLGSLVAIITTWLNRKTRDLERGLTPVATKNHVLVLGWTNRTIHIASELFISEGRVRGFLRRHGVRRLKVIILSEDVGPERVQALKENRITARRLNKIILRSGSAIDRDHLRRVNSLHAAAIIIPHRAISGRELITPDVQIIKTLLSLNAEAASLGPDKMPYVVAELEDENKLRAAYRAYTGPLEVISGDTIISRLVAQNIRHQGLSDAYNQILSLTVSNSLYVKHYSQLAGKPFRQIEGRFSKAICLGVVRVDQGAFTPFLNPPDDFVFEAEDRLVVMARSEDDADMDLPQKADAAATPEGEVRMGLPVEESDEVVRVLILGWNHHITALLRELNTYAEERYEVTIASIRSVEERERALSTVEIDPSRVQYSHEVADYVRELELMRLAPHTYHTVVFASTDRLVDEEEADARTMVGYILLEQLLQDAPQRPQVLLELTDPDNAMLVRQFSGEVMVSPVILSHLLAQIALRRELFSVFNELFTVGGAEIIFRKITDYGLAPGKARFADIAAVAKKYNEIALGLYHHAGENAAERRMELNPPGDRVYDLEPEVKIAVITTVY